MCVCHGQINNFFFNLLLKNFFFGLVKLTFGLVDVGYKTGHGRTLYQLVFVIIIIIIDIKVNVMSQLAFGSSHREFVITDALESSTFKMATNFPKV